jgi:site-specific DNA-cytosine methylase
MKVLELFSGTGSVGKCCKQLGWDVVSVDLLLPADHQIDIMNFDYKQYSKDEFDIVWASPPCTEYSNLQSCWLGRKKKDGIIYTKEIMEKNMDEADKLVLKAFEIIEYFNPHYWFLENPATGKLKSRDIMKDKPFYDVSYCMYSDWGYEKKTRIWTNKKDWTNLICDKSGACGNMINSQHNKVLGNGYEIIDGNKVLCNTKALRQKHKLNSSKEVHTVGERKHKARMGTSKTVIDNGKMIRVNTAELRIKYKDYENVNKSLNNETDKLDRYRIPEDLIFSLFLD